MTYKISREDLIFVLKKEIKQKKLTLNCHRSIPAKEILRIINSSSYQEKEIFYLDVEKGSFRVNVLVPQQHYTWPGYKQAVLYNEL